MFRHRKSSQNVSSQRPCFWGVYQRWPHWCSVQARYSVDHDIRLAPQMPQVCKRQGGLLYALMHILRNMTTRRDKTTQVTNSMCFTQMIPMNRVRIRANLILQRHFAFLRCKTHPIHTYPVFSTAKGPQIFRSISAIYPSQELKSIVLIKTTYGSTFRSRPDRCQQNSPLTSFSAYTGKWNNGFRTVLIPTWGQAFKTDMRRVKWKNEVLFWLRRVIIEVGTRGRVSGTQHTSIPKV